jgi:hypothetical protein
MARESMQSAAGASTAIGTTVMCEVMDCDAARRDALLRRGYIPAVAPSILYTTRSLADILPASMLPEGFTMHAVAGEHEAAALGAVHNGAFTPKRGPCDYLPVMRTPGYAAEHELVVVAPDRASPRSSSAGATRFAAAASSSRSAATMSSSGGGWPKP